MYISSLMSSAIHCDCRSSMVSWRELTGGKQSSYQSELCPAALEMLLVVQSAMMPGNSFIVKCFKLYIHIYMHILKFYKRHFCLCLHFCDSCD